MKTDQLFSELGLALGRGDVALWVGPAGLSVVDVQAKEILTSQQWMAVWAESRQREFADALETTWRERSSARMVIEVPDLVEDALGEHFKFSDFCPYFYLNGKGEGPDTLSPLRREDSKREKARYLERLRQSVLLICGYENAEELISLLDREVGEYGATLRLIVLAGCPQARFEQIEAALQDRRSNLMSRVLATENSLSGLVTAIEETRKALPTEPTVLVGNASIRLGPLLRTEPPIDQDFIIVTEQETRRPEAQEDKPQMLVDLLAGRQAPWRAFSHGLAWNRRLPHLKGVFEGIERVRKEELTVCFLEIPAEPGAGLTVLLQQIVFETARRGHPSLLHRPFGTELNYDLLRRFLTDIQHEGAAKGVPPPIAVLVFDAPSVEGDWKSFLQDLPGRLARDSRRAVVIRGIPVRQVSDVDDPAFKRSYHIRARGSVAQEWLPPISGSLTADDQYDLADWAAKHFDQPGHPVPEESLDTIRSWKLEEQRVPLLICLYFILTDEFRTRAGLGKHLIDRLRRVLPLKVHSQSGDANAKDRPATREELLAAFGGTGALGPRFDNESELDPDAVAALFITLAALGSLRIGAPRDVLDAISGVSRNQIQSAITLLEKNDLALTDLPVDGQSPDPDTLSRRKDDRLAPLAFYTVKETVGLRHPAYGRLVLDWLRSPDGATDRQELANHGQPDEFLRCSEFGSSDVERRFRLLEPILKSLLPNPAQSQFAADLSVRFLRLQRRETRTEISQFQWQKPDLVRTGFSWLNEAVVRQNAATLHSRAITRYKTCFRQEALQGSI